MRTTTLLSTVFSLFTLAGCDGPSVKVPDETGDTSVGIDDDSGEPAADPDITIDPASLDLGVGGPGDVLQGSFTIGNAGIGTLDGEVSVTTGSPDFSVDSATTTLLTGQTAVVTVSFAAAEDGIYTGQVTITSNDPDESSIIVYVGATVSAASDDDVDNDGYTLDQDCDDTDATVNPGAEEIWYDGIDENCDSRSDYDQDADGYESAAYEGDDCDDTNPDVSPGDLEVNGNGVDEDCDGEIDEALSTADVDGDGYSEADGDCNDGDATVNPAAIEAWYDGVDQDCSGGSDYDADYDGYESDAYGGDDCDDTDAAVSPSGVETLGNGLDDDCDGVVDGTSMPDDIDGDGYLASVDDCDDNDGTVHPGTTETYYDGVDQDCDGQSDYDADIDGYDSADYGGDDCDDADSTINPGVLSDTLYDGIDQDCSGGSDYDGDGDGYDSSDYGGDDCNDLDPSVNPGASEVWYDGVDGDCDGGSDYDQDGDGWTSADYGGIDCDDTNAAISPSAVEVWYDGTDSDCSGGSDYDQDGDGVTTSAYGGLDCDDTDSTVSPSMTETCDGVDNDCDGSTDEGVTNTYYRDGDSDGYGLSVVSTTGCSAPAGYSSGSGDCDDSLSAVNPGAAETCNSRDDDCDGIVDDGVSGSWYRDADGDGYGTTATTSSSCTAPAGYVASSTDCNDSSSTINPAATETCNSVDDDCDGIIDDGTGSTTYYPDADSDGYGSTTGGVTACSAPSGYRTSHTDCDDTVSTTYLGATETCNGVDDDCDGTIDDGTGGSTTYYADADGDGYGDASVSTTSCSAPSGYVTNSTDCDDTDATSHPGASEVSYDAADNDCDGYQDEMLAATESDWTVLGEQSSDAIGNWGVHAVEDLNGDGNSELVICAGSADYYYSRYYTYSNLGALSFHDVDDSGLDVDFTDGFYEYWGYESGDYVGSAFANLGDIDGDGYDEIAVGSYSNNANETDDGEVYIIDIGGESGYDFAYSYYADGAIFGDSNYGYLGYSLASGDFDGDGTMDLASGAPGEQSAKGRVYVTFDGDGLATDLIDDVDSTFYVTGVSNSDHLGYSEAFGDFNDDGYDDLVACSPDDDDGYSSAGTCWVVNGASTRGSSSVHGTTISSLDSAVITGSAASDQVGYTPNSLSVGDLNADGVDDLAVGVPGYDGYTSGGGGVWVYTGGSLSGSETYATANYLVRGDGSLGTGVNMTGDVTGDGAVDLLAGATTAGSNYGVVYLFEGGQATGTYTLPTDQYASWTGEASGDAFGTSISGLQDLDGDGRQDFAVGASGNDDGASGGGKVYVLPAYP